MSIDGLERFPSARDIEKVARNPECQTLRTALAGNVDLRAYAKHLGLEEARQSPMAIGRGQQVERSILGDMANRLCKALVADGKLREPVTVEDLKRKRTPNRTGMAKAANRTDECILALMSGKAAPAVLIHPVLSVALGADVQYIEPDALVLYVDRDAYEPVELKSYPFREGRTDPEDLRQARRQGAVYVHALRRRVEALGGDAAMIEAIVTLVFTKPNSLAPKPVYSESVEGEMHDVLKAVRLLDETRAALPDLLKGRDIDEVLPTLPIHYSERCLSFCSLAKRCRDSECAAGNVSILGERTATVLAGAGRVDRALRLLDGARPRDEAERVLTARLLSLEERLGPLRRAL